MVSWDGELVRALDVVVTTHAHSTHIHAHSTHRKGGSRLSGFPQRGHARGSAAHASFHPRRRARTYMRLEYVGRWRHDVCSRGGNLRALTMRLGTIGSVCCSEYLSLTHGLESLLARRIGYCICSYMYIRYFPNTCVLTTAAHAKRASLTHHITI